MPTPSGAPKRFERGKPILARDLNALREVAIAGLVQRPRNGPAGMAGRALSSIGGSLGFIGRRPQTEVLIGRIIEVIPAPGSGFSASGPGQGYTYEVAVIGRPESEWLSARAPDFGRPARDADDMLIWPAQIDDWCIVLAHNRGTDSVRKLWIITEAVAFGPCAPPEE